MIKCFCKKKNKDCSNYFCEKTLINYECCICLNGIDKGQSIKLLKCNHIYHTSCIEMWFKRKRVCPVCNIAIAK